MNIINHVHYTLTTWPIGFQEYKNIFKTSYRQTIHLQYIPRGDTITPQSIKIKGEIPRSSQIQQLDNMVIYQA